MVLRWSVEEVVVRGGPSVGGPSVEVVVVRDGPSVEEVVVRGQ